MLKTNELRIGNLVIYASKIVEIEGINKNTIYHSKGQFDQNIEPAYEPFRQIKLTEDWLLKLGFALKGSGIWFKDLFEIHIMDNGKIYLRGWQNGICQIEYVNQLQNLHYSLTGEEIRLSH